VGGLSLDVVIGQRDRFRGRLNELETMLQTKGSECDEVCK
jgi:hypothetical protein